MTKKQVIDWKNALLQQEVRIGREVRKRAPRTVKDVHLAALKAVCQYLVDEDKLAVNPVAGVVVRNVETERDDDEKGFSDKDARTILTATLQKGSHLLSVEMTAARRWIPWIGAYTGARVNEITSLLPSDVVTVQGILCFSLPKERSKGKRKRIVPIHSHLIEQGLRAYVAERKKLGKPLFYDPARSRGGKAANPHYQKVGERLAEWVRTHTGILRTSPLSVRCRLCYRIREGGVASLAVTGMTNKEISALAPCASIMHHELVRPADSGPGHCDSGRHLGRSVINSKSYSSAPTASTTQIG